MSSAPDRIVPVICPYGVLGETMLSGGFRQQWAPVPESNIVIVDPAGLSYIQESGPSQAGGASGAIYRFLGIGEDDSFVPQVRSSIHKEGDAKFASYGEKHCIHVVGPNFNDSYAKEQDYEWATAALSFAYENVFREFANCDHPVLRILPISGSIFAGKWRPRIPELTLDAWTQAATRLTPEELASVTSRRIELCVYETAELPLIVEAFGLEAADDSQCFSGVNATVVLSHTDEVLEVRLMEQTTSDDLHIQVAQRA